MITACTNDRCFEFRGLSTDTKPTDWNGVKVGNGSLFICMDNSTVFMFDEVSQAWLEL